MTKSGNMGLGIDFQPGFQDGLVNNRGSDVIHEIGVACPKCRTSDAAANLLGDGQAATRSPNCPNCVDGWLFRNPAKVRGLVTSIRQQKNILDVGIAQPGDMSFSPAPGTLTICGGGGRRIARGDKLTATWSQPLDDGQTVVRGAAHLGDNVRLANNVETGEDRLWYEPAESLWCEDENGIAYQAGTDFSFGPGRVIKWIGEQPAVGTKYVIKYTAYFEWLVFVPPQERVDRDNRDLGPLVLIRRRHIAFLKESPYINAADRVPMSTRVAC
jgi:hypothetical protein